MGTRVVQSFEGLTVSTVDWPVILMEFPETFVPEGALHDAMSYFEELLKRAVELGHKTYTVTDLTRMAELAPARQRKYVGDWIARTLPLQKAASLGGANVTPSAILRGLITAVYWFAPPPLPSVFVATRREAFVEAIKTFDAARVQLPSDLRAALMTRT